MKKRECQELEFWNKYYGPAATYGQELSVTEIWPIKNPFLKGELQYMTSWKDDGVYIHACAFDQTGIDILNSLNSKQLKKICDHYKDTKINFAVENGQIIEMSIRAWSKPFKEFLSLNNEGEKYYCGENIYSCEIGFEDHIYPIIEGIETEVQ